MHVCSTDSLDLGMNELTAANPGLGNVHVHQTVRRSEAQLSMAPSLSERLPWFRITYAANAACGMRVRYSVGRNQLHSPQRQKLLNSMCLIAIDSRHHFQMPISAPLKQRWARGPA
jgi:hypothetical protein